MQNSAQSTINNFGTFYVGKVLRPFQGQFLYILNSKYSNKTKYKFNKTKCRLK